MQYFMCGSSNNRILSKIRKLKFSLEFRHAAEEIIENRFPDFRLTKDPVSSEIFNDLNVKSNVNMRI